MDRKRVISQGQYVHPRFAAESFVGQRYAIADADGEYSADPADYWSAPDSAEVGMIIGPVTLQTVTGRLVTTRRALKSNGTIGDLRRLARAAESLVVPA